MQIKTTMSYHFMSIRMAIVKKTNNKCWQGCGKKEILMHCWWECKLVQPLWKIVWRFQKIKNKTTVQSSNSTLDIYPKKTKTLIQKNICTPLSTAALFTIAKIWKKPKCPIDK